MSDRVSAKRDHYGEQSTPLILLIYSTDPIGLELIEGDKTVDGVRVRHIPEPLQRARADIAANGAGEFAEVWYATPGFLERLYSEH